MIIDLRPIYHEHVQDTREQLRRARQQGLRVNLPISDLVGSVNTYRMSDRKIESLSIQCAEFVMNIAVHQHNEEVERKQRG